MSSGSRRSLAVAVAVAVLLVTAVTPVFAMAQRVTASVSGVSVWVVPGNDPGVLCYATSIESDDPLSSRPTWHGWLHAVGTDSGAPSILEFIVSGDRCVSGLDPAVTDDLFANPGAYELRAETCDALGCETSSAPFAETEPVPRYPCSVFPTVGGGSARPVVPGEDIHIEGLEFAPGDVEVVYTIDGRAVRTEILVAMVQGDGQTRFDTVFTPEEGDVGLLEIVATEAEGTCSSSTAVPILGPAAPLTTPPAALPDVATGPGGSAPLGVALGTILIGLSAVLLVQKRRHGR